MKNKKTFDLNILGKDDRKRFDTAFEALTVAGLQVAGMVNGADKPKDLMQALISAYKGNATDRGEDFINDDCLTQPDMDCFKAIVNAL